MHYDFPSLEYFLAKFRQRQASDVLAVFYVRYWLARIARESSLRDVEIFYRKYIALSDEQVLRQLLRRGIVLGITSVARIAAEIPVWPATQESPAQQSGQPEQAPDLQSAASS